MGRKSKAPRQPKSEKAKGSRITAYYRFLATKGSYNYDIIHAVLWFRLRQLFFPFLQLPARLS